MARQKAGGGRVTKPDQRPSGTTTVGEGSSSLATAPGYEPLYKRKPLMFAFMMIACAAMVLSMMAGIFTTL